MDVKEALTGVQTRLTDLRERRELLAAELAQIDSELKEATEDEAVLSRLLARHEGISAPAPAPAQDGELQPSFWRSLPRTTATERVLLQADEPLSPMRVHQALKDHGRDDALSHVHAALGHLKDSNRAVQPVRGVWVHPSKINGQTA